MKPLKSKFLKALILSVVFLTWSCNAGNNKDQEMEDTNNPEDKVVLVIHGGAGTILKKNMSDSLEQAYIEVLQDALQAGYKIINEGGSSLKAVEQSIVVMEDSPLFNAGKGAVFTHQKTNELDASVMTGNNLDAGAVAGVTTVKNPIKAAIAVMEQSPHVMLSGPGAEEFATQVGLEIVDPEYFYTEKRYNGLLKAIEKDENKTVLDHDEPADEKFGTVGCVALDGSGIITAGTSTGGMTNKRYGRIGDSPVIGAGTYANNQVGISCTGWGEYYIRVAAASQVARRMEYLKQDVSEASQAVIDEIGELGGNGGIIALDNRGNVAMPFNTKGMYRAYISESGEMNIQLYE